MRPSLLVFLVCCTFGSTLVAAAEKEDDLSGIWSLEQHVVDGKQSQAVWNATYEFSGKTLFVQAKVRTAGNTAVETSREGTFAVESEKTPAEVNLRFKDRQGTDVYEAIYTCRDDRLHIWYFMRAAGRPTQKEMAGGEGIGELILKRQKRK